MKKKYIYYILFIIVAIGSICFLYERLKKKNIELNFNDKNYILINVLDKEYFDDFNIKDSIHVPYENFQDYIHLLDKNKKIILYCSNYFCTASHDSADMLIKHRFKQVYVYAAGASEWFLSAQEDQKMFPYNGKAQKKYLTIKVFNKNDIKKRESKKKYKIISTKELQEIIK